MSVHDNPPNGHHSQRGGVERNVVDAFHVGVVHGVQRQGLTTLDRGGYSY